MIKSTLPLLALCAAPVLFALAPQKRASDKKVVTFEENITQASKAWADKQYGKSTLALSTALGQSRDKHREVILAAMPTLPEGWTKLASKKDKDSEMAAAMFGGMAAFVPIEQAYKQEETNEHMTISLTMNSPMIQMMTMQFGNPAYLEEGSEMIEYENGDKGILKIGKRSSELDLVLGSKHYVQIQAGGQTGDWVLKAIDQEAVNRLKTAIDQ